MEKGIRLPLRGCPILLSLVLQTKLDSTQSCYHYLLKDFSQEDIEHYLITLIPTTVYKGAALSTFKCLVLSHPFCQELCRQLRATQGWDSTPAKTTHLQHGEKEKGLGSGRAPKYSW